MAPDREIPLDVLMRYFRVPTGNVPAHYPGRDLLLHSILANISPSGAFVRTNSPLPEGSELEISFTLPGCTTEISIAASVRWCCLAGAEGQEPGMGLEFKKVPRRHLKAIERYIRGFLQRMRAGDP